MPCSEKPIVRESFAMYFGGGRIFFMQLDGLGDHKALVMDKFQRDMETLLKPSATSQVGLHLKDTRMDRGMMARMIRDMGGPGQHIQKVAVVGLGWRDRLLWRRLLHVLNPPPRYALGFFEDFEKAKLWLVA